MKKKKITQLGFLLGSVIGVLIFSISQIWLKNNDWFNQYWFEKQMFSFAQFSQDGTLLASVNYHKGRKTKGDHLTVFDQKAGQVVALFKGRFSEFVFAHRSVLLSSDNRFLVRGFNKQEGQFFTITDLQKNQAVQRFEAGDLGSIVVRLKDRKYWSFLRPLAFSRDGSLLAVSRATNQIDVFNLKTKQVKTLRQNWGHTAFAARFSADGALLMIRSYKGATQIWDVKRQKLVMELNTEPEKRNSLQAIAFSPDGRYFVLASAEQPSLIWPIRQLADGGLWIGQSLRLKGEIGNTTSLLFSGDSQMLLIGNAKGDIAVFDMKTGQVRERFSAHKKSVIALHLSPDNKIMRSFGKDNVIKHWNFETKALLRTYNNNGLSWVLWLSELWAQFMKNSHLLLGIMIGGRLWLGQKKTKQSGVRKNRVMTKQEEIDYWDPPEAK